MKKVKGYSWEVFFLIYILILFRITVFRSNFSLEPFMQNGILNLTLFQNYIPIIVKGRWFLFIYLFVGNIVWFVPFGFILLASGKVTHVWLAVLWGFGLSLCIETMQYIFGTGVSELDDLVLNTLGTLVGAAIVKVFRSLHFSSDWRVKENE